jgi:hypothetical protein
MLKTQPLEEKPPQVLGEEEIFSLQDRENTLKALYTQGICPGATRMRLQVTYIFAAASLEQQG